MADNSSASINWATLGIAAAGALTAFLSYQAGASQARVESEDERVDRIYTRVLEAVQNCAKGDPMYASQIRLAMAYVSAAAREDVPHDKRMKSEIMRVAGDDGFACSPSLQSEIRSEEKVQIAQAQQASEGAKLAVVSTGQGVALNPVDWRNFDLDVLWCEDGGDEARRIAEQFAKPLLEDPERQSGNWSYTRVRSVSPARWTANNFPSVINGVQVRFDDEGERAFAERVASLQPSPNELHVDFHPSTQRTSFYVSALVCPART